MSGKKNLSITTLLIFALAALSTVVSAFAPNTKVDEKITFKKGEKKVELNGQIEKSQQIYVYLVHAEKGQSLNLAAVFRGNFKEDKPNAVFRDNTNPPVEIRGLYKSDDDETTLIGTAKDGKWSGTITESGDYLIIVLRPATKENNEQEIYPYRLLVWMK
jgi:hypothetical protein